MNIVPDILAVLRQASEPLSNIAIREQIAALDDVPPIDAQHLVADAINALVQADQVERVWSEGRCTYLIAPDASAGFTGVDPVIAIDSTRREADALPAPDAAIAAAAPIAPAPPVAPSVPPPQPPAKANAMHATQQKMLDILTKAGAPLSTSDILKKMPGVNAPAFSKHRKQLCDGGAIVAHGQTANRTYGLPGSTAPNPSENAPKPKPHKQAVAPTSEQRIVASASALLAADPHSPLSIADLRAAASDILRAHGADPLPRSLHRLVIASLGAPESLAA